MFILIIIIITSSPFSKYFGVVFTKKKKSCQPLCGGGDLIMKSCQDSEADVNDHDFVLFCFLQQFGPRLTVEKHLCVGMFWVAHRGIIAVD